MSNRNGIFLELAMKTRARGKDETMLNINAPIYLYEKI